MGHNSTGNYSYDVMLTHRYEGVAQVARGGSWNYDKLFCRSAERRWFLPDDRCSFLGFQCVLTWTNNQMVASFGRHLAEMIFWQNRVGMKGK